MSRYVLVNKPYNVLSNFVDEDGRATLKDLVPVPGVYAAGRLDYDSEGLLLLTDDGPLSYRMTDPAYEHPKTYYVQVELVKGSVPAGALEQLRAGVVLRGERLRSAEVDVVPDPGFPPRPVPVRGYHPTAWLRVVLREGKKRQLRRMTAAVGLPALRLVRTAIGPLALGDLAPGAWRELSSAEIRALAAAVGLAR
jgi:23S rRNA pseudouridine2457 synthase